MMVRMTSEVFLILTFFKIDSRRVSKIDAVNSIRTDKKNQKSNLNLFLERKLILEQINLLRRTTFANNLSILSLSADKVKKWRLKVCYSNLQSSLLLCGTRPNEWGAQ